MRLLRPASEDDMVATFLAAEVTSERYGPQITDILARLGQSRGIVERPDTRDEGARRLGPWPDQPPGTIYRQVAENLRHGRLPPPIILLGEPGPANLVVIEGHKRLTGLLLCPQWLPAELTVLLGITAYHRK